MTSYDVTGGGPAEAPTVDFSVPLFKLIRSHLLLDSKTLKLLKFRIAKSQETRFLFTFTIIISNNFKVHQKHAIVMARI